MNESEIIFALGCFFLISFGALFFWNNQLSLNDAINLICFIMGIVLTTIGLYEIVIRYEVKKVKENHDNPLPKM